jgi:hypothetical protein
MAISLGILLATKRTTMTLSPLARKSFSIQDFLRHNTVNGANYRRMNARGQNLMNFGRVKSTYGMKPPGRRHNMDMGEISVDHKDPKSQMPNKHTTRASNVLVRQIATMPPRSNN